MVMVLNTQCPCPNRKRRLVVRLRGPSTAEVLHSEFATIGHITRHVFPRDGYGNLLGAHDWLVKGRE
jgi:hypothetical protein